MYFINFQVQVQALFSSKYLSTITSTFQSTVLLIREEYFFGILTKEVRALCSLFPQMFVTVVP